MRRTTSLATVTSTTDAGREVVNRTLIRVLLPLDGEGSIVVHNYTAGTAAVVFDSETAAGQVCRLQEVSVSTIVPVSEVAPRTQAYEFPSTVISLLLAITKMDSGTDLFRKKGKDGKDASTPRPAQLEAVEDLVLWRAELKRRAFQTLQIVLQHVPWCERALRDGLLPDLIAAALVPVALPQFIASRWLQDRSLHLRERLLDAASGVSIAEEASPVRGGAVSLPHCRCVLCIDVVLWCD
jgi:hypothetical protein